MSEKKEVARRYNTGKMRWRNLPLYLFEPVIKVGMYGEQKYSTPEDPGTLNFLKGLPVTDVLDSIKRHLCAFESPHESDIDVESQCNHILHVAWNCIALYETLQRHPELDDRPQSVKKLEKQLPRNKASMENKPWGKSWNEVKAEQGKVDND